LFGHPQKHPESPKSFWCEQMKGKEPAPIDEGDLANARAWWERYQNDGSCALQAYPIPHIAGIDPDETTNERLAREYDMGSAHHVENRRRLEQQKREMKKKRAQKAEERIREYREKTGSARVEPIKPGVKGFFIRPAMTEDLPDILNIFNFYVEYTCYTPETEPWNLQRMQEHFNDVKNGRYPFLVAFEKGGVVKPSNKKKHRGREVEPLILPDKLIGFAFADGTCSPSHLAFQFFNRLQSC
jgi:hypothetical protein